MTTPIEYANQPPEPSTDRSLRLLIALAAIAHGGVGIVGWFTHMGLVRGWLASPRNMTWSFEGGIAYAYATVTIAAHVAAAAGGLMLLRRRRVGRWLIAGAMTAICAAGVLTTIRLLQDEIFRTYWSTPGAALMQAISMLSGLWFPILLGLLAHPRVTPRLA